MTTFPYLTLGLAAVVILIICASLLATLTRRVKRLEENQWHFIETMRALGDMVVEHGKHS